MEKYIVVIPAYKPNDSLINLINEINQQFSKCSFVIVDDGSGNDDLFNKIAKIENVVVLKHETNKGKGFALKTAFRYLQDCHLENSVIVTADADGQHRPQDIYKVAKQYETIGTGIVLGSRVLEKDVPLRSRFGNTATKFIYRTFYRQKIQDNQTGLRAFSKELLNTLIDIPGDRYEYEMNVLMECPRKDIKISEVNIETVYLNNNQSSHFKPVRDFLKICRNMLKYAIPSIISLISNVLLFISFYMLFSITDIKENNAVLLSCILSTTIALIINYLLHRFGIFFGNKSMFKIPKLKKKYLLLGTLATIVHISSVFLLFILLQNVVTSKIVGDIDYLVICFVFNYFFIPRPKTIIN